MDKRNAMEMYEVMLHDCPDEGDSIENRIRSGVCKMLATMWREYWMCCFEGRRKDIIKPPEDMKPLEATKKLWLDFVDNERQRWTLHLDKLSKFGRKDDAQKEQLKITQLEKLVLIWKQKVEET